MKERYERIISFKRKLVKIILALALVLRVDPSVLLWMSVQILEFERILVQVVWVVQE